MRACFANPSYSAHVFSCLPATAARLAWRASVGARGIERGVLSCGAIEGRGGGSQVDHRRRAHGVGSGFSGPTDGVAWGSSIGATRPVVPPSPLCGRSTSSEPLGASKIRGRCFNCTLHSSAGRLLELPPCLPRSSEQPRAAAGAPQNKSKNSSHPASLPPPSSPSQREGAPAETVPTSLSQSTRWMGMVDLSLE